MLRLLGVVLAAVPAFAETDVVPIDLLRHDPRDSLHLRGLPSGELEWSLPAGMAEVLTLDLRPLGIDPGQFDEVRFEIQPLISQVGLNLALHGYPGQDDISSWYLKFPARTGEWSEGRFDLHLDDDGMYLGRAQEARRGALVLNHYRRILGYPGEPAERKTLFRHFRLVRRRVSISFSLLDAEPFDHAGEVGVSYPLRIKNLTGQPQRVVLDLDSARTLKYFQAAAPAESFDLRPGEEKGVPIRLFMPRRKAMSLPPLYSEPLIPKAFIPGLTDSDVIPLMGYRRFPLWASVPVFHRNPWNPESFQAFLAAREKAVPGIRGWLQSEVAQAGQAMKFHWPVPDFGPPIHDQAYRCDRCRVWLQPETPITFHKHICPACKAVFENNDRYDRAWLMRYNCARAQDVRHLALAWLATGDPAYARKAAEILLDYAARYPEMPIYGRRSTSSASKLGANSLHSSYVTPHFAEGYSLLEAAPCLDEAQRNTVVSFLRQAAADVISHSVEYNNQQAEHFRAYGSVGLATSFWPFAAEAIYGDFGWHELVEYGFSEDGIAHEGGAYHRAVFGALNDFAAFAHAYGVNLYTPRLKRVFDGTLAASAVPVGSVSYELAYNVYRDPQYLPLLSSERQSCREFTALYGVLGLPDVQKLPATSILMPGAGYVYLRQGSAADWKGISLNYIKPFDRGERDKLTTFFLRNGGQVDSTVGRITYGSPHAGWMESTAAHNTIVIDGNDERDADASLLVFDASPEHPLALVATDPAAPFYEGVRQVRCIALIEGCYVVFDHVSANRPRTMDRYQYGHSPAAFQIPLSLLEHPPEDLPKRGSFSRIEAASCGRELRIDFKNALKMRLISDGDLEAFKGLTVGGYQADPMELTFARRKACREAIFLAAFSLGAEQQPPEIKLLETGPQQFTSELKTATSTYTLSMHPAERKASVTRLSAQK
ncbi:MAG: alginate lyase family protein [Planctomycetes bacterium]|nr:alginate lyase family protein [Planctomycetota bacterium]